MPVPFSMAHHRGYGNILEPMTSQKVLILKSLTSLYNCALLAIERSTHSQFTLRVRPIIVFTIDEQMLSCGHKHVHHLPALFRASLHACAKGTHAPAARA